MRYTNSLALACAMGLCGLSSAHATDKKTDPGNIPAVTDWSSRSVVYSKPMTPDEFAAAGRNADMGRLYNDPRYLAQLLRRIDAEMPAPAAPRTNTLQPGAGSAVAATAKATLAPCPTKRGPDPRSWHCTDTPQAPDSSVVRDWSNVLGGGTNGQGGRGMEGVYPAKYRFDITQPVSAANCPTDFIVYPTNAAGATQVAGTNETWVYTFSAVPNNLQTFTIGPAGPRQVVLTASSTSNTQQNFRINGVANTIQNLRDAVNRWSGQTGYIATAITSSTITITANTLGNIPDGHISNGLSNVTGPGGVNGSGTAGQPTIIAFNQLYNGTCTTATGRDAADDAKAPNVMWSYNTGAGYVVETSPVLSWHDDAKQVAFIQRNGNTLQLVLLKPAALTTSAARLAAAANPTAITSSSAATYAAARSGSAAVMTAITLNGITNTGSTPTYSSPFVDYAKDELYVGDGNGQLHKFTGVFKGTPAEVTSGGFPATVASGMKLSAPVYYNGNVYIGSQSGAGDLGGKLHRISATNGAVVSSKKLSIANAVALREAPIVTGAPTGTGSVFAFLFADGTAGNATDCAPTIGNKDSCRVVARFIPGFADGTDPAQRIYVGRGNNANSTLYAGAFDDAYYDSANGTGAMYIVGGEPSDTFIPHLWKVPLINGVMGNPVMGSQLANKTCSTVDDCGALDANGNPPAGNTVKWNWSPVAYAKRSGYEYIYVSMPSNGNQTGCAGACLYMYQLTGNTWGTSNAASAGLQTPGGTGGIVLDNNSTAPGAAQIYFTQQAAGGNAVQASQSGLE